MPSSRFDLRRKRLGQCPALAFQLLWYPSATGDLSLPSFRALPATLAPANAADLSGLAPSYIGTAEHNPLRDDGIRDAELLGAAGVSTQLRNEPHMVHCFVNFALALPAAADATNRGMAALNAALH